MAPRESLGEFEQRVLWALIQLEPNAYGVPIRQFLEGRAGKTVSIGAVYTTLARLEEKGFVASRVGEPTPQRGGRAKKYFSITARGRMVLNAADAEMAAIKRRFVPSPIGALQIA